MNTIDSNKTIAAFMGDKHSIAVSKVNENGGYYHQSWDWLMPVVERIDEAGASVIIGRMFCEIRYIDPLNEENHFDVRIASGVKINAIVGAVLDFIQWYNTKKAKITRDGEDVHVICPHCAHCESHPADEQRHHLQTFTIIDWMEDKGEKNEFSLTKCVPCKGEFELEWDYTNTDKS